MTLERRPWRMRSESLCRNCGNRSRKIVYPIEEGKFRWENRCALCGEWTVKHPCEDPRFYQDRPVEYVE